MVCKHENGQFCLVIIQFQSSARRPQSNLLDGFSGLKVMAVVYNNWDTSDTKRVIKKTEVVQLRPTIEPFRFKKTLLLLQDNKCAEKND